MSTIPSDEFFPAESASPRRQDIAPFTPASAGVPTRSTLRSASSRASSDRLYVACTRARDQLLITGTEPASAFLSDLHAKS